MGGWVAFSLKGRGHFLDGLGVVDFVSLPDAPCDQPQTAPGPALNLVIHPRYPSSLILRFLLLVLPILLFLLLVSSSSSSSFSSLPLCAVAIFSCRLRIESCQAPCSSATGERLELLASCWPGRGGRKSVVASTPSPSIPPCSSSLAPHSSASRAIPRGSLSLEHAAKHICDGVAEFARVRRRLRQSLVLAVGPHFLIARNFREWRTPASGQLTAGLRPTLHEKR